MIFVKWSDQELAGAKNRCSALIKLVRYNHECGVNKALNIHCRW